MIYTRYATRTGRGIGTISLPDGDVDMYDLHATGLYLGEFNPETHYILNGAVTARPAQLSIVDVEEINVSTEEQATFTLLPDPCTVTINGPNGVESVEITGGTLEFSAAFPGDYSMTFEAFPYLPYSVVIHAV
jgi:hypothetical protein